MELHLALPPGSRFFFRASGSRTYLKEILSILDHVYTSEDVHFSWVLGTGYLLQSCHSLDRELIVFMGISTPPTSPNPETAANKLSPTHLDTTR